MKEITQIENHVVEIWRRPGQRHMHLRVRPDRSLRVTCNRRAAKRDVLQFVKESHEFILRRLGEIELLERRFPPKTYLSQDTHLYYGERLPLQVIWTWSGRYKIQVFEDHIEIAAPLASTARDRQKALHKYLRALAAQVLRARVEIHAAKMDLWPAAVTIRGQKTRWGSCSSEGRVNLNWKLIAAPPSVIDYVVVHELAHLRHMNHSAEFWRLVERHFPGHRAAKIWLRQNEAEINHQFQKPAL